MVQSFLTGNTTGKMATVESPAEDPMIRWRNYQHLIWSQQQIHLQIQQQQLLQHETNNNQPSKKGEDVTGARVNPPPQTKPQSTEPSEQDAKDMNDPWEQVDAHSAFLGPTLWDKRLPYDGHDFKLEYVDLEEFLTENGIPVDEHGKQLNLPLGPPPPALRRSSPDPAAANAFPLVPPFYPGPRSGHGGYVISHLDNGGVGDGYASSGPSSPSPSTSSLSQDMTTDSGSIPSDQTSGAGHEFDPRIRMFSTDELKPQPMIKKSKKQYVPDNAKDAKYWMRRRKNNMAAKRSRDARRVKENQIAMRACYLEKENQFIKQELERIQKENSLLKEQLTRFSYTDPVVRR